MFIQELRGVRASFRATAGLADGYAARYQNQQGKSGYTIAGMQNQPAVTIYGVASRGAAEDLRLLLCIADYTNNGVKNDLCYVGASYISNASGVQGFGLNTYTGGFTVSNVAIPQGQLFQYTARIYSIHPESFSLRINGQPATVVYNGKGHAQRYLSDLLYLGGDNNNGDLDWIGAIPDTVIYLGDQPASVDAQNEAYLLSLYNISV